MTEQSGRNSSNKEYILMEKSGFASAERDVKEIFSLRGPERSTDRLGDKSDRRKRRNMIHGPNSRDTNKK